MDRAETIIAVMAHNEERRIGTCLASLPLGEPGVSVHVIVNGSRDRTAQIAGEFAGVIVHEYAEGGKSRSWNRFVFETRGLTADVYVFVDGDAEVLPGSIAALTRSLAENPDANAAAAMPRNGRNAETYRRDMIAGHGLFGDLYALRGSFVERMRARGIRLPDDLVGDDGLICAMAKTDLANEDDWRDERVLPCPQAGFLCEPTRLASPGTLAVQYRRMINYSLRHYQNRIVSQIMRGEGPTGLPRLLARHYADWLPRIAPRSHPVWWWFDRQAIRRMARAASVV